MMYKLVSVAVCALLGLTDATRIRQVSVSSVSSPITPIPHQLQQFVAPVPKTLADVTASMKLWQQDEQWQPENPAEVMSVLEIMGAISEKISTCDKCGNGVTWEYLEDMIKEEVKAFLAKMVEIEVAIVKANFNYMKKMSEESLEHLKQLGEKHGDDVYLNEIAIPYGEAQLAYFSMETLEAQINETKAQMKEKEPQLIADALVNIKGEFTKADTDGNGSLTNSELLTAFLKVIDHNQDGEIVPDTLVMIVGHYAEFLGVELKEGWEDTLLGFLSTIDTNEDGMLSFAEIQASVAAHTGAGVHSIEDFIMAFKA